MFVLLLSVSCTMENTPEEYFDRTALNANLLVGFGTQDFNMFRQSKLASLPVVENNKTKIGADSYTAYIEKMKLYTLNQQIEKIQALKPTAETKPMIDASLSLFDFVKQKYTTDYTAITRLMDEKAADTTIDKAIAAMEEKNMPELDARFKKLMDIALPYAKKHGIKVTQNKF
jgi:hypothetical protein